MSGSMRMCFLKITEKAMPIPGLPSAALGKEFGQMLSFLAAELRSLIAFAYEQDVESMVIRLELFLEIYQMFVCAKEEEGGLPDSAQVKETMYWFASDYSETMLEKNMRSTFDWKEDFALRIIMDSDLCRICAICTVSESIYRKMSCTWRAI